MENFKEPDVNWDAIDTVLLDMDGTILDLSFDNFFWLELMPKVYAEKEGLSITKSQEFLRNSYGAIEGKLQWYCLDFWSERLGIDIPKLKMSVRERVAFRPGAVSFLKFLQENKKRVYLATNAHRKSLEIKLLITDFNEYFCDLSSAHDFGYPKEEQAYWHALNRQYSFDKRRTLFVDDNLQVLESAKAYGIGHLLSIRQPDSTKPPQDCGEFAAIGDFRRLISHA